MQLVLKINPMSINKITPLMVLEIPTKQMDCLKKVNLKILVLKAIHSLKINTLEI